MKNINSRIIKRFNEIYDNTNVNSADGIYKKMNREGYSITVKTVKDLLKKNLKKFLNNLTKKNSSKMKMITKMSVRSTN